MKSIKVKDIMIPISNYVTVSKSSSLIDVVQALDSDQKSKKKHAHRDAVVLDDDGLFIGKITMIDIFQALEPNYKKIDPKNEMNTLEYSGGMVTKQLLNYYDDLNLWVEPMKDICNRGKDLKVVDIMHMPEPDECVKESDTLEKALNRFVIGAHQPLVVKNGDKVTGLLRFGDLFEIVRSRLLGAV